MLSYNHQIAYYVEYAAFSIKIVITGTRGANVMGGVETHCEELFPRIADYRSSRIAMN